MTFGLPCAPVSYTHLDVYKRQEQLDENLRYELLTRLDGMPKHTKLCHGDFCPSNIIVGDDGKWYLVDWVHASQGNASADVARTLSLIHI